MSDKFFPTYQLEVQTSNGGSIVIPADGVHSLFNVNANITYQISESPNNCDITIYNLSKATRDAIYHDSWNYFEFRRMTFKAGYGGNLMVLFDGNIKEAYSDRQGVDVTTKISGWDAWWYNNNYTRIEMQPDATRNEVLEEITSEIITNGVSSGNYVISDFSNLPPNLRAETLRGRPQDLIKERIGQGARLFHDSGTTYILKDDDVIGDENNIPLISSESGLLGVPVKRNRIVEFKMLFEPSLRIGRAFELRSSFSDQLNGVYKVMSVTHSLSLGENNGGENITKVKAWNTNQGFNFLGMM